MKSIKFKIVLLYILLVFLVMVVSGTFILTRIRQEESNNAYDALSLYTKTAENRIINVYDKEADFNKALIDIYDTPQSSYNAFYDYQIAILDNDGINVIASTDKNEDYSAPVIISTVNGEATFQDWRKSRDANGARKTWFELAVPVTSDLTNKEYIIYVKMDATSAIENLVRLSYTLIFSLMISIALAITLGFLFSNTITKPIIQLTTKAKKFSKGDFEDDLKIYSNDEIGQLTKTLNEMGKNLKSLINSISLEKNKIEIILHGMTDGILAYDMNGHLIHGNVASCELLDRKSLQLIKPNDIFKIIDEPYKNMKDLVNVSIDKDVNFNDKYLNVNITSYNNNKNELEGIIIVLKDITKHTNLDNMRKEFVANVSHELRTPLTTIKSYAETLKDIGLDDLEMAQSFLSIIETEADRMTLLVKDLLDLSKFDSDKFDLDLSYVNLTELINATVTQNQVSAENKNQIINFKESNKYFINCDQGRINQVLTNILSNAIKYSGDGAKIDITLQEIDKFYEVQIADNGMGIPKKDVDRIFERFYRVDKARSRSLGGTGLGLSITKQIILAHGGEIEAKSTLGVGTTMIIRFKKETKEV